MEAGKQTYVDIRTVPKLKKLVRNLKKCMFRTVPNLLIFDLRWVNYVFSVSAIVGMNSCNSIAFPYG